MSRNRPHFVPLFTIWCIACLVALMGVAWMHRSESEFSLGAQPLLAAPSVAANAAYPAPEPETPPPDNEGIIAQYARWLGISYEEAAWRLGVQSRKNELYERLWANEPSFVTGWLVHQPEFLVVLGFIVPNGDEIVRPYLDGLDWAHVVRTKQVKYTLEQLSDLIVRIAAIARTTGLVHSFGTNIPESKVSLYTLYPDELRARLQAMPEMQPYLEDIEVLFMYPGAPASGSPQPQRRPPVLGVGGRAARRRPNADDAAAESHHQYSRKRHDHAGVTTFTSKHEPAPDDKRARDCNRCTTGCSRFFCRH
jgi:hypothetical protein